MIINGMFLRTMFLLIESDWRFNRTHDETTKHEHFKEFWEVITLTLVSCCIMSLCNWTTYYTFYDHFPSSKSRDLSKSQMIKVVSYPWASCRWFCVCETSPTSVTQAIHIYQSALLCLYSIQHQSSSFFLTFVH